MENHRVEYPCDPLPTICTLCTMMGRMRDAYPEIGRLDMDTVDVCTAYNQYLLQVGKAVLLTPAHPTEPVIAISIVGVFGDGRKRK